VVPNIKNVQELSMVQIQQQLNVLRDKAQEGKLTAKDLFDGTVSISNIGKLPIK
jgi:2-oxoisovalerate dehydrogenase E2 component (dihydrolipoyl transacylase)